MAAARKTKTAAKKRAPKPPARKPLEAPGVEPSGSDWREDELRTRVGANLTRLLKARKMTEEDLAIALGWTHPTTAHGASNIRQYVGGKFLPREPLWIQLAAALGVDPAELVKPL